MRVEAHQMPLLSESYSPTELTSIIPHHIKASEQLPLNVDGRKESFTTKEKFRFEIDMPGVRLVKRRGSFREDIVNIMNGSVNPLGILNLDNEQWRELTEYLGEKDGSISLGEGVLIEGHILVDKKRPNFSTKIPVFDRVILSSQIIV